MIKRIIGMLCVCILVISLCACGKKEPQSAASSTDSTLNNQTIAVGTGNFQDYWNGENYFNLIDYLKENDYKSILAYDSEGNIVIDGKNICSYSFNDVLWQISVFDSYIIIRFVGGSFGDNYIGYSDSENKNDVVVDQYGTKIYSSTINALGKVIENINSDPANLDPTRDAGFDWVEVLHK